MENAHCRFLLLELAAGSGIIAYQKKRAIQPNLLGIPFDIHDGSDDRRMRTDAELHADAMAGGPEAFSPIVERYQDAVFGIALARVRDFHEAEDIAQGAFIEAFERLDSLKDPARLGAWLRSITMHIAIDRVRRRRGTAEIGEDNVPASRDDAPHEQLERNELVLITVAVNRTRPNGRCGSVTPSSIEPDTCR